MSPCDVVRYAVDRGIRGIAITDHDTIDGNPEALRAGRSAGLPVIPGVEISTQCEDLAFHLLGYGIRRITPKVKETFAFLLESRTQRNPQIIEKLRDLGIEIRLEEVVHEANGSVVGRPHFARVLLRKGVVHSIQDAFDRFLARGASAYVEKERLSPAEAIDIIREAGGIAILAHPGIVEQHRPGGLPALLDRLTPLGLVGIEVYYSTHSASQTDQYLRLARERDLLLTGGSDFHRPGEGGPELGSGFGNLRVPYTCFQTLQARTELAAPRVRLNPRLKESAAGKAVRSCPRAGT
jgi:predicted metal-dependent phosphoesterase TrpH